jgi:predicted MFS family arabinose efflux permease
MAAAGGSAGVLLGGVLTDWLNWRAVMLVNVPLVAFALFAAWRLPAGGEQHERPDGTRPRLDLPGAVLVTAGATLLVLGVVRTGTAGWASAATAGTLTAAAVLLTAFVLVERRVPEPLLRPGLLANRAVLGANLFMMLLFSGQFAAFYFTSLYLSGHLGYGPAAAGVAFLPFCLGVAVGSVVATRLVARTGLRALMAAGALVAAAGFAWFGVGFAAGAGVWAAVVGPSLVTSAGIGMCFVPLGTAATAGVGREAAGMASGLVNSSRQIGGSLGLAALETLGARGDGGAALGVAAGLLALAALVALLLVPGRAPRTGGAAAAPAEPPAPRPAVR